MSAGLGELIGAATVVLLAAYLAYAFGRVDREAAAAAEAETEARRRR